MEPVFQAHPIPQNVTNFEFHLVGDMTLKQFGYLAAGLGFAFLIFTTLSTVQPIIAWPLIIISALLGVAFAFLPIQERPLDHWVGAFFKAIFQPTSLKYSSKILKPEDPLFNRRLNQYIKSYKYIEAKAHAPLGNPRLLPTAVSGVVSPKIQPASTLGQKKQNFIAKFKAGQTSFQAPPPNHPHSIQPQSGSPSVPKSTSAPQLPKNQTASSPTAVVPTPAVNHVTQFQSNQNLQSPISNLQSAMTPTPGILRNMEVINKLPNKPLGSAPQSQPSPVEPVPEKEETLKPEDLKKTVELAKQAQSTQQEIIKIETSLSQIKQQAAQPGTDPKTYVEEFEDLLTQLQKLNEKASKTAQELAEISRSKTESSQPEKSDIQQSDTANPNLLSPVSNIESQTQTVKAQSLPTMKLTSFPNIINGIITDSQGNYIEGAIVVAHDRQGLPVRALKSNKLGQFVAATPLPTGEYAIVVEKDNLKFDKVGIELKNEILPPILVAAKKVMTAT